MYVIEVQCHINCEMMLLVQYVKTNDPCVQIKSWDIQQSNECQSILYWNKMGETLEIGIVRCQKHVFDKQINFWQRYFDIDDYL